MSLIYLKLSENAVISEERVAPLPLLFWQCFTGYVRTYCFNTKTIDFLVFLGFFRKPKASAVSLGSRPQGYYLNIFENGRKGGHLGAAR